MKSVLSLSIFLLFLAAPPLLTEDRTGDAIDRLDSATKSALTALEKLSVEVTNLSTPAAACATLNTYCALVSNMLHTARGIAKDCAADSDTARLRTGLKDDLPRLLAAGSNFGRALGKLSPDILASDEFRKAFEKLKALGDRTATD